MDQAQIAAHLFSHAEQVAKQAMFAFRPNAASLIQNYCATAAANIVQMQTADPTIQEQALLKMAEIVVVHFVDEMIAASRRIKDYSINNPGYLGEETFDGARKHFCPCWPFC